MNITPLELFMLIACFLFTILIMGQCTNEQNREYNFHTETMEMIKQIK